MTKYLRTMLVLCLCWASGVLYAATKPELDKQCLAAAIYHEAGNQPLQGQYAVAEVVMNRVRAGFAPNVCAVLHQHVGSHWQFGYNVGDHRIIPQKRVEYFYEVVRCVMNGEEEKVLPEYVMYFNNIPFDPKHYELYTKIGQQFFYRRKIKLLHDADALIGSHENLLHQNEEEKKEGLPRIQNDSQLNQLEESGDLVQVPVNEKLRIASNLPQNRRYCRAWTASFLTDLSNDFYQRFHTPLLVDSAVRTVVFQKKLMRHNKNAAAPDGDAASPHLSGNAVDLAKGHFTHEQLEWMRGKLAVLSFNGVLDVEEEFHQKCFHVSVYSEYVTGFVPNITPSK